MKGVERATRDYESRKWCSVTVAPWEEQHRTCRTTVHSRTAHLQCKSTDHIQVSSHVLAFPRQPSEIRMFFRATFGGSPLVPQYFSGNSARWHNVTRTCSTILSSCELIFRDKRHSIERIVHVARRKRTGTCRTYTRPVR
ncbi:hypothetical protein J1614_008765 [Plenodomus biglobosus]|nr:hypothetical protein J1614_008765 [Plenodomus biglobosus]